MKLKPFSRLPLILRNRLCLTDIAICVNFNLFKVVARYLFATFVVVGLLSSTNALACRYVGGYAEVSIPESYAIERGDYIFVMLANSSSMFSGDYYRKQHEEFYKCACVNKKYHDKYEKKHCENLELAKRYPKSGLYKKNNSGVPLWTINWYLRSVYLSSDNIHLVHIGSFAQSIKGTAVEIYQRGKLLADYRISDLVDDERKLARTTAGILWSSNVDFNEKKHTFSIKTFDDNEFIFDIRTGKIIKYQHQSPSIYHADIIYKNGTRTSLNDFSACGGLTLMQSLNSRNRSTHVLYTNKPTGIKGKQHGELVEVITIPFKGIRHLRFVKEIEKRQYLWEMTTTSGNVKQVIVDAGNVRYCGKDPSDKLVKVSIEDIANLELSHLAPPVQADIRTTAQRMRWDKNNWDKARKEFCDNTHVEKYKTFRDMKRMITRFKDGDCSASSRNFVSAIDKANNWLLKQTVSNDLIKLATKMGEVESKAGLYAQSLKPYEYVMRSYNKPPGKICPDCLLHEAILIKKLIKLSKLARLPVETRMFQALYNKTLGELKRYEHTREEQERRYRQEKERQYDNKRLKTYLDSINDVAIELIKPNHDFMSTNKYLLDRQCSYRKAPALTSFKVYQRIVEIEKMLHPKGHIHLLKALIELSQCGAKQENQLIFKKNYLEAYNLYHDMYKNRVLSINDNIYYNRKLMYLNGYAWRDRNIIDNNAIVLKNDLRRVINTLGQLACNLRVAKKYSQAEAYYKQRIKLSFQLDGYKRNQVKVDLQRFCKLRHKQKPSPPQYTRLEVSEKVENYYDSLKYVAIDSIKPDHDLLRKIKYLLDDQCNDPNVPAISSLKVYQRIAKIEKKLHPKGHIHLLNTLIRMTDCNNKKGNRLNAKKSFHEAYNLYLHMDNKSMLTTNDNLNYNRKLFYLTAAVSHDVNILTDYRIKLYSRRLQLETKIKDIPGVIDTLGVLAWELKQVKKYSQAEAYFKQRIKLSAQLNGYKEKQVKADLEAFNRYRERQKLTTQRPTTH